MKLTCKAALSLGTLAIALMAFNVPSAVAQSDQSSPSEEPAAAQSAPSSADSAVIGDQAFSAIRYARTVKVLPDGKLKFLRNELYPIRLARDADGRIYLQSADPKDEDLSTTPAPPIHESWGALVFDPTTQTITHWPEGERSGRVAVVIRMTAAQVAEAEKSTSAMPEDAPDLGGDGATVTTENLGEKTIEGVRATGIRTTSVIPAGHFGNKLPIVRIHERWISTELNLVLKVIDGDPHGKETVSGLEHISVSPDPGLFPLQTASRLKTMAEE